MSKQFSSRDEAEPPAVVDSAPSHREEMVAREKARFGGVKWGSAFFGWLAAMGTTGLLIGILSAVGAGVGLGVWDVNAADVTDQLASNAETVSTIGAIVLTVILFIAYFCGGYVAGRMARFSGAKQGVAVWVWAIVFAVIVAVVTAIAGSQANLSDKLHGFPRIPIDEGTLTATGVITAVVTAVVSLAGAILGGLSGMRYHRKVDHAGLDL